jgi:hypothetical protein
MGAGAKQQEESQEEATTSSRQTMYCHGGVSVEEMATKRKQKQNLDMLGNKHEN